MSFYKHAVGQHGAAYDRAVGGYETGLVGAGLVGAAAHYSSLSLKSEDDYLPGGHLTSNRDREVSYTHRVREQSICLQLPV